MSKVGRNDPCPCGSGKKHKHCCLDNDEAVRRAQRDASNAALAAEIEGAHAELTRLADRYHASTEAGDAIWAMIEAKQYSEAESAALEYLERFPGDPVGYDLMSLLSEARGEP